MAVDRQLLLPLGQRLPARNPQLPFDQIDPGDFLGDGVLDLKAGVHLHEKDAVGVQAFAGVGDEFDRACALVIDRLGGAHGGGADGFAGGGVHAWSGGFLDHLLVAALQ